MNTPVRGRAVAATLIAALLGVSAFAANARAADAPPAAGAEAKDFELASLGGSAVKLSKQTDAGPVVLVVLRGWPGYQCPICTRQFIEFRQHADALKKAGATVLFVYPGPADGLREHADEFVRGTNYPDHFVFLLDPDFSFTNAYGLRWDEKNETAHPATFVLDKQRKVTFAKVSKTHGDRAAVTEVLKAVEGK